MAIELGKNTGLVLEGGGMRGVFTCGVLDAFMKHEMWFRYVVGVSAGAGNGSSYLSKQIRRARISNIDFLTKYDFIGLKHLLKQGCIFDQQLLYDRFPKELLPYDFETYRKNRAEFEIVTTNCQTGRACYLSEKEDYQRFLDIIKASGSLPYVSKMVDIDGVPMLDGGIVDSIPIKRAMEKGHDTNIVILTRNYGYRKSAKDRKTPRFIYRNYPRLRLVLSQRGKVYNEQLALVEELEKQEKVIIIRPKKPLEVDRMTNDVSKLERLYEEGYQLGEVFCRKYKF